MYYYEVYDSIEMDVSLADPIIIKYQEYVFPTYSYIRYYTIKGYRIRAPTGYHYPV